MAGAALLLMAGTAQATTHSFQFSGSHERTYRFQTAGSFVVTASSSLGAVKITAYNPAGDKVGMSIGNAQSPASISVSPATAGLWRFAFQAANVATVTGAMSCFPDCYWVA
jgi:hypothetical protein